MTPSASFYTRTSRVVAIVLAVLAVVAVRVVTSAKQELEAADALLAKDDIEAALVHYRRAARWYAPGSPFHVRALDRLEGIGRAAEQAGDVERALAAQRAVRGSIMATRSFYVPEQARLSRANQRIATLMASLPPPGMDLGKDKAQLRAEHLALLVNDPGPSVFWTGVLLLGFFAWISAAFAFSTRAIDEHDHFVVPEARKWGAVIVLGFGLFVLGMALA